MPFRRSRNLKKWIPSLEKDRTLAVHDLFALDSNLMQNARLFKIDVPEIAWKVNDHDVKGCYSVVLLERDCSMTCVSLCESGLAKGEIPSMAMTDSLLIAGNLTLSDALGGVVVKPKVFASRGLYRNSTGRENARGRRKLALEVPWNEYASYVGIKSADSLRANVGALRDITWPEAFSDDIRLSSAVIGCQRGDRPNLVSAVVVLLILLTRSAYPLAPLPFSGAWHLVFMVVMLFLIRENSAVSPSLAEMIMSILAVVCAGMARRADAGWAILFCQTSCNLFLALGGAVSTRLSLSSLFSLALYLQQSPMEGTLVHRLTSAPVDIWVLYRAWASLANPDLGEEVEDVTEALLPFYFVCVIASLASRYVLVVSYLAFALPGTPWILDKSGRVKRAVFTSLFSTIKAELNAAPARLAVLVVTFGVTNFGPVFVVPLFAVLVNSQDDALVQISQATYQALMADLTVVTAVPRSTATGRGAGQFKDAVVAVLEQQAEPVQRALVSEICKAEQHSVGSLPTDTRLVRQVTARMLKEAGVDSKHLDSFLQLAQSRKLAVIIRATGQTIAHVTRDGGMLQTALHRITGPNGELGALAASERLTPLWPLVTRSLFHRHPTFGSTSCHRQWTGQLSRS